MMETVVGTPTTTSEVRQPKGSGRQQPMQDTCVPLRVVVEYRGIGAKRN
jgi:hypothetical protein